MDHPASEPRTRRLLAMNAILLAGVAAVSFAPSLFSSAVAQSQPAMRARGEYTMISGKSSSGGAAIYVLDASNHEMIALRWDLARRSLVGLGYRNLTADGQVGAVADPAGTSSGQDR
jgi:hypothetical protein